MGGSKGLKFMKVRIRGSELIIWGSGALLKPQKSGMAPNIQAQSATSAFMLIFVHLRAKLQCKR